MQNQTPMAVKNRPVIFLAFANDRVDDAAYLRNLPKELDGIRKALYRAQEAGLCEVVERANVTVENILNVFQDQRYRDRIAIFHYGGHANGYQLLLESAEGNNVSAKSEGLVPFFARQRSLKLIFLNGCSSQQQSLDLIEAGLPAVVGTSQSINDDVATSLAIRFYNGLGNGAGIDKAWQEAIDEVKIQKGTANMRDLFWDGMETTTPDTEQRQNTASSTQNPALDRFPWEIYYKQGAEIVKEWNLPEQVGNPLFNLPEIPKKHNLPESPFLFLKRYERKHARVFFGRSYYIRELYNKITDVSAPPIILLYGQTGVGKSSLFDSGINPRLEESHIVKYIRRDGELGLVNGLKRALDITLHALEQDDQENTENVQLEESSDYVVEHEEDKDTQTFLTALEARIPELQGEVRQQAENLIVALRRKLDAGSFEQELGGRKERRIAPESEIQHLTGLLKQWRTIEARTGKPLIIILDQVEELFTRPIPNQPKELDDLLKVFDQLFANPIDFPKGKIVMGYRKEYNPEIEEGFKQHSLPRTKVFLEHLSRKDIVEIFDGLSKTPELKRRYNLTVEEELPVIVADDLLEDKNSSVAPVLQILLTKMWSKAKAENADAPTFTVELYQGLRREGILLDDFYFQQMEKLRGWAQEVEMSGFALSILQFHTTRLGTAGSRHIDEIRKRYKHREKDIDTLIEKFKELYLLNESGKNVTGLAHDTIAPLIQNEYRISERPGQRAARILDNKAMELRSNPKTSLDIGELDLVETGQAGMRYWVDREWELVEKSRLRREKNKRMKRQLIRVAIATTILIIVTAFYGIKQTKKSKGLLREVGIYSLAEKAKTVVSTNPTLALSMAKRYYDAMRTNEIQNFSTTRGNDQTLANTLFKDVLVKSSGQKLYNSVLFFSKRRPIETVSFSDKEHLILTTTEDNQLSLWDTSGVHIRRLHRSLNTVKTATFSDDSVKLVYESGNVRVSNKDGDLYRRTRDKRSYDVFWEKFDGTVMLYTNEGETYEDNEYLSRSRNSYECVALDLFFTNFRTNKNFQVNLIPSNDRNAPDPCTAFGASDDGKFIVFEKSLGYDSLYNIYLYGLSVLNTETQELKDLDDFDGLNVSLKFHPDKTFSGAYADQAMYLLDGNMEYLTEFYLEDEDEVIDWKFVPQKEQIAFLMKDYSIVFYSFEGKRLFSLVEGSESHTFGFSPTGKFCYKISTERGVHIWNLSKELIMPKWENDKWVAKFTKKLSANARFSSDGKYIIDRLPSDSLVVRDWRNKKVVQYLPPLDSLASKQLFFHSNGALGHLSNYEDMMLSVGDNEVELYGSPNTAAEQVLAACLSSDGQVLFAGHHDQVIAMTPQAEVLDSLILSNLQERLEELADDDIDTSKFRLKNMQLAISSTGNRLAVLRGGFLEIYDMESYELIHAYPHEANIRKITLSSDGKRLAVINNKSIELRKETGEIIDSKMDSTLSVAYDMRFDEDDQHLLIFTSKGVYLWGAAKLLNDVVGQLGLTNPSLRKEVNEILNEREIIRDFKDPLFWKRVFFLLFLGTVALILLNQSTMQFDNKEYMKVAMYAPVFGFLILSQAVDIFESVDRQAHHQTLDTFMMLNLPFFFYLTFTWYRKLKGTEKIRSYIYLGLMVIGAIGMSYFLYQDYHSFFHEEYWWNIIFGFITLGLVLTPLHLAVKYWYQNKSLLYWIFTALLTFIMFTFVIAVFDKGLMEFLTI